MFVVAEGRYALHRSFVKLLVSFGYLLIDQDGKLYVVVPVLPRFVRTLKLTLPEMGV